MAECSVAEGGVGPASLRCGTRGVQGQDKGQSRYGGWSCPGRAHTDQSPEPWRRRAAAAAPAASRSPRPAAAAMPVPSWRPGFDTGVRGTVRHGPRSPGKQQAFRRPRQEWQPAAAPGLQGSSFPGGRRKLIRIHTVNLHGCSSGPDGLYCWDPWSGSADRCTRGPPGSGQWQPPTPGWRPPVRSAKC